MNELSSHELNFPVKWHYKIITETNVPESKDEICKILSQHGIEQPIEAGNYSSNGKYLTYKVTVEFYNREDMDALSTAIAKIDGVKYLI